MHSDYFNPAIRKLRDDHVGTASRQKQIECAQAAETLLGELKAKQNYPYPYIHCRVTGSRSGVYGDLIVTGHVASHDLRLFVEDVSDAADIPADAAGERVLTIEELARQLNVSTKTISRWRRQGLIGRRFAIDGRKRIGFLQSSVDRFVAENPERVRRGARFSQLTEEERTRIIDRARRLTEAGQWPSDVTKHLARETGRSVETIRYTLKRFNRSRPESAVFPEAYGAPGPETKQKIYQLYRRGSSIEALSKRFYHPKAGIRRVVREMRARRVLELPLDCVPNPLFATVSSSREENAILAPAPAADRPIRNLRPPDGLPPYLRSLYEVPLLTREQEIHLFRKMNYLKYKAARLRQTLDPERPKSRLMSQIERLHEQALATKNQIIRANLRLVVSIAKRHAGPTANLFELTSDGNMSLIRAVDRFDFARGNKFSTYATWAIMKNFARSIPNELRHRDRFRTGQAELFAAAGDDRTDWHEQEMSQRRRVDEVARILQRLDERERRIVVQRFGLEAGQEPRTLRQVGANLGVTKERIRQLEARALSKLRQAAAEENVEVPACV